MGDVDDDVKRHAASEQRPLLDGGAAPRLSHDLGIRGSAEQVIKADTAPDLRLSWGE